MQRHPSLLSGTNAVGHARQNPSASIPENNDGGDWETLEARTKRVTRENVSLQHPAYPRICHLRAYLCAVLVLIDCLLRQSVLRVVEQAKRFSL